MTGLIFALGGLFAGLLSGLFGVGGGTLVVPLLLLLKISIHDAVGLSLVYILFSSASGSLFHGKAQALHMRPVLLIALGAWISSYFGVQAAAAMDSHILAWLFAALMSLVIALFIWRSSERWAEQRTEQPAYLGLRYLGVGALAGFLSSLFGVGGGFIMVPLLVVCSPLNLSQATATSLAGIFFIALSGTVHHILWGQLAQALMQHGLQICGMALLGIVGAPLGAVLHHKIPGPALRLSFICFSILVTGYLVFYGFQMA